MKAIVIRALGGPEQLGVEDVPDPVAGPGEVVVQLKAAALNHRDVWIRLGKYPGIKFPMVLGSDGSGDVHSIGAGVDASWHGKPVIINPGLDWGESEKVQGPDYRILGLPDYGTYAEYVKVPVGNIYPKPENLSYEEASAVPLAGLTAYRAVASRAKVQPGESVLITGIGGGVSTFALQIAKQLGATVLVTSGSDNKLSRAREMKADYGFNYKTQDWVAEIRNALNGNGPDVVIDSVGGETFAKTIDLLSPGGRIAIYGATTGLPKEIDLRKIFWKQLSILGSTMGTPEEFSAMIKLYESGDIRPALDKVFSLEEAALAHQRMEQAEQFGKILLRIS